MKYTEMTVTYLLDENEMGQVDRLLKRLRGIPGIDGSYPFENYTREDTFRLVMQTGYACDIGQHLKAMEERIGGGE